MSRKTMVGDVSLKKLPSGEFAQIYSQLMGGDNGKESQQNARQLMEKMGTIKNDSIEIFAF